MAMPRLLHLAGPVLAALLVPAGAAAQSGDYAAMLGYLADSRIDGRALAGAHGAIAVNMAAGDLNLQANLRSLATGAPADGGIRLRQARAGDAYDTPLRASATLGGDALAGAGGIASINQASGSANAQFNAMAVTLAGTGIRETNDEALASFASAGERGDAGDGRPAGTRSVAVEATALRGFEGVLQLNQIAGSGNATGNQLSIALPPVP